jgi:hypothetical protein
MPDTYQVVYYGDRPNESMGGYSFPYQPYVDKFDIIASTVNSKRVNELTEDQAAYIAIVLKDLIQRESLIIEPEIEDEAIEKVQAKIDLFAQQEADRNLSPEIRFIKQMASDLNKRMDQVLEAITKLEKPSVVPAVTTTAAKVPPAKT